VRFFVCLVIALTLAGVSLEGQAGPRGAAPAHAPAKPADGHAATPAKPTVAPAAVQVAPAKPDAHGAAKAPAGAPQAIQAPKAPEALQAPSKDRPRSLEEAAEAIAAALAARGMRPAARRPLSLTGAPAPPRAPNVKRYTLYWPEEDIHWDVQWPIITDRVALTWGDEPEAEDRPASD
jgi:hypothetical protein